MCWGTDPTDPHFSQIQKNKKKIKKTSQTCDHYWIWIFLLVDFCLTVCNWKRSTFKLGRWKLIFWFTWAPAWTFSSASKVFHRSSQIVLFQQRSTQTWQDWHPAVLKWIIRVKPASHLRRKRKRNRNRNTKKSSVKREKRNRKRKCKKKENFVFLVPVLRLRLRLCQKSSIAIALALTSLVWSRL